MQILRPLRSRAVALVWTSQILAATGTEFYMVAVIWIATSMIGRDAGYVSALISGTLLFGSLFGGVLSDRWRIGRTMVATSLVRAAILAVLAAAALAGVLSLPLLAGLAVLVSMATALFEPALQSAIPVLAADPAGRHAANSLFDATRRVARILGPGLIALASAAMPVGSFFIVTAVAFLVSAACVSAGLRRLDLPPREPVHGVAGVLDSLTGGWRAVRAHPVMAYGLFASFTGNIGWGLVIVLGLVLHLRAAVPEPLAAYGLTMSAYGAGNVLASVVLAGWRPRPAVWIVVSKLFFGVGIALMPFAGGQAALMLCAFFAAFNGPLENLALFHMIQNDFPAQRLAQVFRLMMAMVFSGGLAAYLAAPTLFGAFGVEPTMTGIGVVVVLVGLAGLPLARRR